MGKGRNVMHPRGGGRAQILHGAGDYLICLLLGDFHMYAREGGRGEKRDRSPAEAQILPLRRWRYDLLGFGNYHTLGRRGWGRGET